MKSALEILMEQYDADSVEALDALIDTESAKNNRMHIISAMLRYGAQVVDACANSDVPMKNPYDGFVDAEYSHSTIMKVKEELK